jgi:hypothetical protein
MCSRPGSRGCAARPPAATHRRVWQNAGRDDADRPSYCRLSELHPGHGGQSLNPFEHELSVSMDRVRISVTGMVGRRGLSAGLSALDADDRQSQSAQAMIEDRRHLLTILSGEKMTPVGASIHATLRLAEFPAPAARPVAGSVVETISAGRSTLLPVHSCIAAIQITTVVPNGPPSDRNRYLSPPFLELIGRRQGVGLSDCALRH